MGTWHTQIQLQTGSVTSAGESCAEHLNLGQLGMDCQPMWQVRDEDGCQCYRSSSTVSRALVHCTGVWPHNKCGLRVYCLATPEGAVVVQTRWSWCSWLVTVPAEHLDEWRILYDSTNPQTEPLPGNWQGRLDLFQRLLLLRAMRQDKLTPAIMQYVAEVMGR